MFSKENSETAIFCENSLSIQWYFSQISVIQIELSTGEPDLNLYKNVVQLWLIDVHAQLPNLRQDIVKIQDKSHN